MSQTHLTSRRLAGTGQCTSSLCPKTSLALSPKLEAPFPRTSRLFRAPAAVPAPHAPRRAGALVEGLPFHMFYFGNTPGGASPPKRRSTMRSPPPALRGRTFLIFRAPQLIPARAAVRTFESSAPTRRSSPTSDSLKYSTPGAPVAASSPSASPPLLLLPIVASCLAPPLSLARCPQRRARDSAARRDARLGVE